MYKHVKKNISFYGIGFKSGETWSIRRNGFKGFLGKGTNITIFDYKTEKVLLFEGFMDFLSYLTAKNIKKPNHTTIVLNSAVHMRRAIEYIRKNEQINTISYFRDRDNAGVESLLKLQDEFQSHKILDESEKYPHNKDLNEWLIKNQLAMSHQKCP